MKAQTFTKRVDDAIREIERAHDAARLHALWGEMARLRFDLAWLTAARPLTSNAVRRDAKRDQRRLLDAYHGACDRLGVRHADAA